MEAVYEKTRSAPGSESAMEIPTGVLEKVKNFKAFLKEIGRSKPDQSASETQKRLCLAMEAEGIDASASVMLHQLATQILPWIGEAKLEELLRGYYNYDVSHSERVLRYLEFLKLAYAGAIDFDA